MPTLIIGLIAGVGIFLGVVVISKVVAPDKEEERTKKAIRDLKASSEGFEEEDVSIIKQDTDSPGLEKISHIIPTMGSLYDLCLQAGNTSAVGVWLIVEIIVGILAFFLLNFIVGELGLIGFIIALIGAFLAAYIIPRKILKSKIAGRNKKFLDIFPDALDMIVRSVKSGHPVNASMRMVVENIGSPVKEEFKQVMDEVAYGRTLPEALRRMAKKVDESDVAFFVVVISVQQETGGNLAEVLSNLSTIIRQRRMMRLKIKAMTAEARMTMWLLGAIPVLFGGIMSVLARDYMSLLVTTLAGKIILVAAISLVVLAVWIVSRMSKIDI